MPAEHRVRVPRRGPEPSVRRSVETVRLSEAVAVLDDALGYVPDLPARTMLRTLLVERLEKDARR